METTPTKPARQTNEIVFTPQQVNLIKSLIAKDASDDELRLFLYQCTRTGLDPLTRQIYCISRNVKDGKGGWRKQMTIQTSIDGFRVIAERSGDYAGQDEPEFIYADASNLLCCKVRIYRFKNEQRYQAAVGVAFWKEYVQIDKDGKPAGLWNKMPHTMISKVAEALALRKAYPQDLSGLYTGDEMEQGEVPIPVPITQPALKEVAKPAPPEETILDPKHNIVQPSPIQNRKDDTDTRPWLSERQFKQAIDRVTAGDLTAYHNTVEQFRMKRDYRTALNEVFEFSKSLIQ